MKIQPSGEILYGSYVLNKRRGGEPYFVVFLDLTTLKAGDYGDHLTLHELGHVVANYYFDATDYERFFALFRQSPDWRECFETPEGAAIPCVPDEEILADQLAFYANGKLEFRSSYDVPPLAETTAMAEAIVASAPR
jgi:hypothetical protein